MSKEEVINSEPAEPEEDWGYAIFYKSSLSNYECKIGYYFYENGLRSAKYIFDSEDLFGYDKFNKIVNMLSTHDYFKELLTKKYGKQLLTKEVWSDEEVEIDSIKAYYREQLKNNPIEYQSWSSLNFSTKWETNKTIIELNLYYALIGSIFINYDDKKWFEHKRQEKEKELLEAF